MVSYLSHLKTMFHKLNFEFLVELYAHKNFLSGFLVHCILQKVKSSSHIWYTLQLEGKKTQQLLSCGALLLQENGIRHSAQDIVCRFSGDVVFERPLENSMPWFPHQVIIQDVFYLSKKKLYIHNHQIHILSSFYHNFWKFGILLHTECR